MLNIVTDFLISPAFADGAAAPAAGQQNPLMAMLPFVLIFFIFYFLMIRPQKKKMQQEQQMLKALNKGDEVVTKAGMLGVITGMTDRVITLEVSEGIRVKILREHVGGLAKQLFEEKEVSKKSKK